MFCHWKNNVESLFSKYLKCFNVDLVHENQSKTSIKKINSNYIPFDFIKEINLLWNTPIIGECNKYKNFNYQWALKINYQHIQHIYTYYNEMNKNCLKEAV